MFTITVSFGSNAKPKPTLAEAINTAIGQGHRGGVHQVAKAVGARITKSNIGHEFTETFQTGDSWNGPYESSRSVRRVSYEFTKGRLWWKKTAVVSGSVSRVGSTQGLNARMAS